MKVKDLLHVVKDDIVITEYDPDELLAWKLYSGESIAAPHAFNANKFMNRTIWYVISEKDKKSADKSFIHIYLRIRPKNSKI